MTLKTYLQYYQEHHPNCVGLSRIGKDNWKTVHADGTSKPVRWFWKYVPARYVGYNSKGICLKLQKNS